MKSWILCDAEKVGTLNQCIGLSQALGLTPETYSLVAQGVWRFLPARFWPCPLKGVTPKLAPPWPDLIIGAGRQSAAPAARIRRLSQGKTKVVQILDPRMRSELFDLIIAPEHDGLYGTNVLTTLGALTKLSQDQLDSAATQFEPELKYLPRPLTSVFVGGASSAYKFGKAEAQKLVEDLKKIIQDTGGSVALTPSRRTCSEAKGILREGLKELPAVMWDEISENPYFGYMALGDFLMITSDSVSMICEACFTGKPTYLYPLPGQSKKIERFHKSILSKGHGRLFQGGMDSFEAVPLRETERIAQEVKKRLCL
ncbi:MAG: hypothetical protein GY915_05115 [bacterium]|nr:hypothetical protein [bacterium]